VNALLSWLYVEAARWCKVFGQGDAALKYYKLALDARPDNPVVLASIGFELARQGRKREALSWFDRAVAARPDYAEGHFDRGFVLQELNDPQAAIAAFDQALRCNPDHDRALYGKALSLIGLRRLDEAIAPLEKNTKLQPFSPFGWYQLGRVQFDRGKHEKTQAIIEHLQTFEPKVAAQLARETGLKLPAS
jgi:tetratricopeptide (TPR) repeat protein